MNIIKKKKQRNKDRYKECYAEFIQRNVHYKKKNSNTHCILKIFYKSI